MIYHILCVQMLFACSSPINKLLLEWASPLTLMSSRLIVAGILMFGSCLALGYSYRTLSSKHIPLFAQKIFFGSYLKYFLKYWGLQYMATVKMAFLMHTTPFFAALFNFYFYNNRLQARQIIGIVIGFFGIIPILLVKSCPEQLFGTLFSFSLPEIAIIGAVAAHSYGTLCTQELVKKYHYKAPIISSLSSLGGGLLALFTALIIHEPLTISEPTFFVPWFFALIGISNIIGHTWYIHLLTKNSTTFLALTDYLNPLFVALYSWILLGETVSIHYLASGCIIFFGLYLFKNSNLNQL